MASRSGVRLGIEAERLPALDGALEAARAGVSTAGTRNNREFADVDVGDVAPELVELAYDPQTAGGLLVSLPRDQGMALEAEFAAAGLFLARIGGVAEGAGTRAGVGLQCVAMDASAQPLARLRGFAFVRPGAPPAALANAVMLVLIVATGATVRLTGSGLGCEHWPGCAPHHFEPKSFHSYIEFSNRVLRVLHDPRHALHAGCSRAAIAGSRSRSSSARCCRRRSAR